MRYLTALNDTMLILTMFILVVFGFMLPTSVVFSETENKVSPKISSLMQMLSKRTIPLLREAIVVSDIASTFPANATGTKAVIWKNDLWLTTKFSVTGVLFKESKKVMQSGEKSITVNKATIEEGNYLAFNGQDFAIACKDAKIIAVIISKDNILYIVTEAILTGSLTQAQKKLMISESKSISVPNVNLKEGKYSTFNGTDSAVILNEYGNMLAILIGENNDCNLYLPVKAKVIGNYNLSPIERKFPEGGKVTFSVSAVKEGTYETFNGSDASFIFDKGEIVAALAEQNSESELYVSTEALVSDASPVATLKNGMYKALVGSKSAVILDKTGMPICEVNF